MHLGTLNADVKDFVQSCIVFTLSASETKVYRPLEQQVHASQVSELPYFDFLYFESHARAMSIY